jgi:hypothetical protein
VNLSLVANLQVTELVGMLISNCTSGADKFATSKGGIGKIKNNFQIDEDLNKVSQVRCSPRIEVLNDFRMSSIKLRH